MHVSWRLWLRIFLVIIAVILVWTRISTRHRPKPSISGPVTDLAATNPLNQPGGGASPQDAYEVYSALYQTPTQESLVFAENSVTDIPQVNGSCLKPSTSEERELTDAFVAANVKSHHWEQKFSIPQGYQLLPSKQVDAALACLASHGRDAASCRSYPQLKFVRFLGVPGFNRTHTRALVSVIKSCGSYCGSGGIFVVEKTDETWRRPATTDFTRDCSWMY